jgi:hypothetical protein
LDGRSLLGFGSIEKMKGLPWPRVGDDSATVGHDDGDLSFEMKERERGLVASGAETVAVFTEAEEFTGPEKESESKWSALGGRR